MEVALSYMKSLAAASGNLLRTALAPLYQRPAGERGARVAADTALKRYYRQFAISTEVRDKILLLREMELRDGRVKAIHGRICRDTIRGGLVMQFAEGGEVLKREWEAFTARLQLNRAQKLRSDSRGLVVEGNLPLQLVLDDRQRVAAAVRMPAETIVPIVDDSGRFKDPTVAYEQRDVLTGQVLATFGAWNLQLARFDPLSYDDMGEMGRPVLDSMCETWRKLVMTEEDMVIRRRMRAPLRMSHVLEGAPKEELDTYRTQNEGEKGDITTDFYSNRKGGVTAIQGDENLSEIGDVVHLLDTFFAGSPAPKGLFGYTDGLSRDVLEDLKRDYYDEIDHVQDTLAWEYEWCFRVHMLLQGVVVDADEISLRFSERRTETPNQVADLALKLAALGMPPPLVFEEMGYDASRIVKAMEAWAARDNPYPGAPPTNGGTPPKVSVTPGNARKGESGTAISQPGSNHGRGRG